MNQYMSKQKSMRAVALIMALVMVVTCIPIVPGAPGTVEAAGNTNIKITYPSEKGKTVADPLTVHNKMLTVDGTYTGMTDPTQMRYTVKNLSTGQEYASTMAPVIETGNRFRFVDVDLFVGLNEVKITYQAGSLTAYATIYVYYNDTPVVADLKMQNTEIDSDENIITVSLVAGQTVAYVDISGIAFNSTELIIRNKTLLGEVADAEQGVSINSFSNDFFTIIPLKAGVNNLELIAKNSQGRTQTLERTVVLNVVSGIGLSLMNMQSNYKDTGGTENRNYLPRGAEVDISRPGSANDQTNPALVTSLPTSHIMFSGRVLLNGNNMLPFAGSQEFEGDEVKNKLLFNIIGKDGTTRLLTTDIDLRDDAYFGKKMLIGTNEVAASISNEQDGISYVDFIVAIPEDTFKDGGDWKYGEYTFVFTPEILKNNAMHNKDFALSEPLEYKIHFVNNTKPKFIGVSMVTTGEYILEHNQPYSISQESVQLNIHHENIVEGSNLAANRIKVKIFQAPYQIPTSPAAITGGIDIPAASIVNVDATRSVVTLNNLPSGNVLLVAYADEATVGAGNAAMIYKRFLVAKGPVVSLQDGEGVFITANKEYAYDEKDTSSGFDNEDEFLKEFFDGMILKISSYTDSALGTDTSPISVMLNDTVLAVTPTVSNNVITIPLNLASTIKSSGLTNQTNKIVVTFKDGNITSRTEFTFLIITEGAPIIHKFKTRFEGVTGSYTTREFGEIIETDKDYINVQGGGENFETATLYINGEEVFTTDDAVRNIPASEIKSTGKAYATNGITAEVKSGGILEFTINRLSMGNEANEGLIDQFHISLEVQKGTTIISEKIIIMPKRDIYTVLAPFRQVVNNNLQPIIIKAPTASSVKIGKIDAEKVSTDGNDVKSEYVMNYLRDRLYGENQVNFDKLGNHVFYAEVPLKQGENKLKLTVTVGNDTYPGELVLFYAGTLAEGAVYQTDLSKNKISPKELGGAISLSFPKNTLLQPRSSIMEGSSIPYELPDFWYDKSLLIGVANKYTGKVDRDISRSNPQLRQMLVGSPNALDYYHYASELFYIDAGTIQNPGGRLPFEADMVTRRMERDVLTTNNRGTLTLQFDPNVVQDASIHMTVMYHPGYQIDGQAQWQNLGGVVNTKNNTITVPFDGFGYYVVMKLRRSFNDVIGHGWARRNMEAVFSKGIMANETPERFGPDRPITRGEFATVLVKALAIELNDGPYNNEGIVKSPTRPTFDDVRPNMGLPFWDYKYIETAARAGIVQGMYPRRFVPNQFLTREQAAVMIARAIEAKLARTPEQAMNQLTKEFTDAPAIEYYALQSIAAISKTGIVVGKPNDPNDESKGYSFLPKNTLTRAEAAVIATRLMQYKKLLPDPL